MKDFLNMRILDGKQLTDRTGVLHKYHSLCGGNVAIATILPQSRNQNHYFRGENVEDFPKTQQKVCDSLSFLRFWIQKRGKKFKNPHKIEFFHVFHVFVLKRWSLKPLVHIAKVSFPRFHVFENLFGKKFLEKIFYL